MQASPVLYNIKNKKGKARTKTAIPPPLTEVGVSSLKNQMKIEEVAKQIDFKER